MPTQRRDVLRAGACIAVLALAACGREGQDEMAWARSALERNERLEVVATDPQTHTFTVRMKDTGELRMVRADQLAALPAQGAPVAVPAAAPAPGLSAASTGTVAAAGELATPAPTTPEVAAPAPEPASAAAESANAPSPASLAQGPVLKAGPGYSIAAAPAANPARAPQAVSAVGPGYSVKSSGAAAPPARTRDAAITSAAVERRHEPIVCQGARLLHIDNRNLEFEGDAVSAEDGCEIHITNSHISATGVGVLARAANVHIDNSLIEGDAGSIDASEGAQIYAASSHFRGLSRRLDNAAVHDLGGNIWN